MSLNKPIELLFKKIGQKCINISYLGKGEASVVYKVITSDGVYVVKTGLYPERKKKVLGEATIRTNFIKKGLDNIPAPIYIDDEILPNGAVIYEFVEGLKPNFKEEELIRQVAYLLAELHQKEYEKLDYGFQNLERFVHNLVTTIEKISRTYTKLVNEEIQSALEGGVQEIQKGLKHFKDLKFTGINARLHGDMSDNFIVDNNNKIWLLDWENSEYGDIMEEISFFLTLNNFSKEERLIFFTEYRKNFPLAQNIPFEDLYNFYSSMITVFDICWGIDQLDMNVKQKLEPERKIRDLFITAKDWAFFFDKETCLKLSKGLERIAKKFQNCEFNI